MNILNKIKIDAFLLRIEKRDQRINELEKQVQARDDIIQEFVDWYDTETIRSIHTPIKSWLALCSLAERARKLTS